MTTEERKTYLICNYISECVDGSASIYRYDRIPANVLRGAREAYADYENSETVLCVVDTTVLGGGQRGMLFTDKNVYYHGMFESPKKWEYYDPFLQYSNELPDDVYFNRKNLQKLMAYLFETEWNMGGISFYDTGLCLIPRMKELLSDEIEEMIKNEDIDLEAFGIAIWELVIETFEFLISPDNWLGELERVFEVRSSDKIKSMVTSFDRFLENLDLETWYLFFFNVDLMMNTTILANKVDREKALLTDSFETLIGKMEDAVNDYYNGVPLIDIVCDLKDPMDAFIIEVKYDLETAQLLLGLET